MVVLGWKAGPEQFPPDVLLDAAIAAELAEFDSLEVSDHFHPWDPSGQASFAWTWLGAAAAQTARIQLGPGVTAPILRYEPAIIAQASATLACMAPGRAFLCVGTGEALNEYPVTAYWPGYRERQERLAEAIDLIRALWTGEEITHDGEYYQTRKARLYTRPTEPIPLYVSTLVPGSARFAGEHGDGLITTGGKPDDVYRRIIWEFEDGARSKGKDPSKMPRLIELNVAYTDDVDVAVQCFKRYWAGAFIPALFNQKIYTPVTSAENGTVIGADIIRQTSCISADPDEHVRFAQHYIDLGFDHVYFHSPEPDQRSFLEGYGRDVLPRLRRPVVQGQLVA